MTPPTAIITGAAGFLGSAITVDLARDFSLVAIDNRKPSPDLTIACPNVAWFEADISDAEAVDAVFKEAVKRLKRVDFVIHFAAFWHFGGDWRTEYDGTNIRGTENILRATRAIEAKRLVFASSVAALEGSAEKRVSEKSPAVGGTPYGRSKMSGERIVTEGDWPTIVLRIGGVFTEWCELPPLWSVLQSWSLRGLTGRAVPGKGRSAIPYIHRDDLVALVRAVLQNSDDIGRLDTFMACQEGAVSHAEIFPIIRKDLAPDASHRPLHLPPWIVRLGLAARCVGGALIGRLPFERPWMADYIDCPWVADTAYTRETLDWHCRPERGILERLPVILERFKNRRAEWEERNDQRLARAYQYVKETE